ELASAPRWNSKDGQGGAAGKASLLNAASRSLRLVVGGKFDAYGNIVMNEDQSVNYMKMESLAHRYIVEDDMLPGPALHKSFMQVMGRRPTKSEAEALAVAEDEADERYPGWWDRTVRGKEAPEEPREQFVARRAAEELDASKPIN